MTKKELNLTPAEKEEYELLQNRIKELEAKSDHSKKLTKDELRKKFAKILHFGPDRPKGMRVKKWHEMWLERARANSKRIHFKMTYAEKHYSRQFRVTIRRTKTIEVHPITYRFEIKHNDKVKTFSSPQEVADYLNTFSKEEKRSMVITIYRLADGKEDTGCFHAPHAPEVVSESYYIF